MPSAVAPRPSLRPLTGATPSPGIEAAAERDLRAWMNYFRERDEEQAAFEARQFAAPAFMADDGLDRYEPCDSACADDPDPGRYDLEGRAYA